jgi:23S rRNA A2030 N6-methylase RlmJ
MVTPPFEEVRAYAERFRAARNRAERRTILEQMAAAWGGPDVPRRALEQVLGESELRSIERDMRRSLPDLPNLDRRTLGEMGMHVVEPDD